MDELISICTFCILAFLSAVNKSKDSLKYLCFMLIYAEIQQHSSLLFMLNCFKGIKKKPYNDQIDKQYYLFPEKL